MVKGFNSSFNLLGSSTRLRDAELTVKASTEILRGLFTFAGSEGGRIFSIAAMNYLATQGLKQSMLYVDADNEPGLALYRSLGFN